MLGHEALIAAASTRLGVKVRAVMGNAVMPSRAWVGLNSPQAAISRDHACNSFAFRAWLEIVPGMGR